MINEILNEIGAERLRQMEKGHTYESDSMYKKKELSAFARAYANCFNNYGEFYVPYDWTDFTNRQMKKPDSYEDGLIKAAALLVAEIERLRRSESSESAQRASDINRSNFINMVKRIAGNANSIDDSSAQEAE